MISLGPRDYERAFRAAGLSRIALTHHQTTGSTNDDARALAATPQGSKGGVAVVIAETQTRARGRGSNVWLSPQGSISFTLTAPDVPVSRLGVLPLATGTCVVGALRSLGAAAFVKWPNDVWVDERKVCGILCESSLVGSTARVFIGIGINVESASDGPIPSGATTLRALGLDVDRPALISDICARVVSLLESEVEASRLVSEWKEVSVPWWGEEAQVFEGETPKRVTVLDVNPLGQLVVRDEGGVVRTLVAGDVRKLRGNPVKAAPEDDDVAFFRDIERAFVERRGDPLFISNADWVFLAKLRKKGVPMRVVLRGMTDAFDAHAHSFARKQKIRSLKFCQDQINAAADRYRRALQADGPSRRSLSGAIERLAERVAEAPPTTELTAARSAARARLREIAKAVDDDSHFDAEKPLLRAEDLLVDAAKGALGGEVAALESRSREATAPYKTRMPAKVYESLIAESVRRKILQRFGLPRFLLAEIE